ncbi:MULTISPECIES: hypothetical protein [unclassified Streptomyces]|uniref:hypothetical protein n=1 Tax=unclassified Streptomyces TaxID=2593676 RepID=UPI0037B64D4E
MESTRGHRWAAGTAVVWMAVSTITHVGAAFIPKESAVAPGAPWGYTAYLVYDALIIAMSVVGTLVCLATVRPWGDRVPRLAVLAPLVIGSVLLFVRGVPGFIEIVLVTTGVTPRGLWALVDDSARVIPESQMVRDALINGYFFLGALCLIPTTLAYARRTRRTGGGGAGQRLARKTTKSMRRPSAPARTSR